MPREGETAAAAAAAARIATAPPRTSAALTMARQKQTKEGVGKWPPQLKDGGAIYHRCHFRPTDEEHFIGGGNGKHYVGTADAAKTVHKARIYRRAVKTRIHDQMIGRVGNVYICICI